MRFFNTPDTNKLIKQIAGELVNITYGETYFDIDGNILEKKIPDHNAYIIDSVEYTVVPNYGVIHIINDDRLYEKIANVIESKFHEMINVVALKFGMPMIPVYSSGTTQYLGIKNTMTAITPGNVMFKKNESMFPNIPSGTNFYWEISCMPIPVSYYTKHRDDTIRSLSSIVVDNTGAIQLPNGFKSPDYPSYTVYKIYRDGRVNVDPISYTSLYGIHLELIKHYPDINRGKDKPEFAKCNRNIKLVKWEWLNFYSINPDSVMEWHDQIRMGLLDTEPNEEVNYSCFTTNAPIYDDCYVFDIVERIVEETIDESDFDKYPGAVIVGENSDGGETPSVSEDGKKKKKTKTTKVQEVAPKVQKVAPKVQKVAPKIIRRGATEATKMIKIKYTKKYDTPKCVLISPYYVHLYGYDDAVAEFERITNTKVFVYRTKSPTNVYEAIKNSNASKLIKDFLTLLYDRANFTSYQTIDVNDDKFRIIWNAKYRSYLDNTGMSTDLCVPDNITVIHISTH